MTLRQENADLRLAELGHEWGILPEEKYAEFREYKNLFDEKLNFCRQVKYGRNTIFAALRDIQPDTPVKQLPELAEQLSLPDTRIGKRVFQELLICAKYDGYLQREEVEISRLKKLEETMIPDDFDYSAVRGLCNESRQKLEKIRPATLGQAGRIDGVTPADIGLLQVHLKKSGAKTTHEK